MVERSKLSNGEMEVVRRLWGLKSATVREVFESFPEDRRIDFATVQTYLRRLETKGYATSKLDGRTRVYTVCVKQKTVIRETIGDMLDRLFDGETLPLVCHLIEDRGVNADELAQLRQLIERLEKKR